MGYVVGGGKLFWWVFVSLLGSDEDIDDDGIEY